MKPRRCGHVEIDPTCKACQILAKAREMVNSLKVDTTGKRFIDKSKRKPNLPVLNCVHLGGKLRFVECESCSENREAKVKLAVFNCEIHGECVPARQLPGLKCCATCADKKTK
jgi:hypothetical protein